MSFLRVISCLLACSFSTSSFAAVANQDNNQDTGNVIINPIEVVESDPELREVYEAQIDTEFFEIGVFTGLIAIENFGTSTINGIKASFHATEDFFLQANLGLTEAGKNAQEKREQTNMLVDRDFEYYNLLVGYNIFPGEAFMNQSLAFNTAFYLVAGAGNTQFNDDSNFTITLGSGYRIILKDWLTWNIDFRDHMFENEFNGINERTHNLEFTTGLTAFF